MKAGAGRKGLVRPFVKDDGHCYPFIAPVERKRYRIAGHLTVQIAQQFLYSGHRLIIDSSDDIAAGCSPSLIIDAAFYKPRLFSRAIGKNVDDIYTAFYRQAET